MHYNPDNFVSVFLSNMFDAMVTTLYFVLCSLPVFTFGAAATACCSTMMAIARGDCAGVTRRFFSTFRQEFKLSTKAWLALLAVAAVLGLNIWICWGWAQEENTFVTILRLITGGLCVLWACIATYMFAGIARFEVTLKQAVINALLFTGRNLVWTLALIAITAVILLLCLGASILALPVMMVGLYVQGVIYNQVFKPYIPKEEPEEAEETEEEPAEE